MIEHNSKNRTYAQTDVHEHEVLAAYAIGNLKGERRRAVAAYEIGNLKRQRGASLQAAPEGIGGR